MAKETYELCLQALLRGFENGTGLLLLEAWGLRSGRVGLVQTNVPIQWNPVYNVFHRFFDVETNQLFGLYM